MKQIKLKKKFYQKRVIVLRVSDINEFCLD
jgi:hypothetical protein